MKQLINIFFIIIAIDVYAEEIPNYCLDSETNAHWESIVERAQYANDQEVIDLYNLRVSLCQQVEKGELTVKEATDIFEMERNRVVNSLQREKV